MVQAGLVLEGGATRGVFTAGVLDYLMEKDVWLSHVIGVSAGCCNGVDYISRQIGRSRDCMIHEDKKESYIGAEVLLKKHCLFDMDKVFDEYPNHKYPFDYDTYENSEMLGEWVVTNCLTGKPEYLDERGDRKKFMNICRASSSMPVISPMVTIDGTPYLDGGISDSIPLGRMFSYGNDKNVVILTRNPGYRKKPFSKAAKRFYRHVMKNTPELYEAFKTRFLNYNQSVEKVERLQKEGKLFVIQPLDKTVSRTETHYDKLMAFYQHGYDRMSEQFDDLMTYLEKKD
ncbi:patatin-like phospholipase family protein [Novisyntrophococcus fermenticellae]|uniref:patatin-like phospholipase family protein n=1 Tax=Novisyntrophococcus fermenticellae TaxID=2068655 RepID=UPI001E438CEA|nr:patatin family protein [Novisyntrophococcus fermenticellae]